MRKGKLLYVVEEKGNWRRFKFNKDGKNWSGWTLGKFLTKIDKNVTQSAKNDFTKAFSDISAFGDSKKEKPVLYSAKEFSHL